MNPMISIIVPIYNVEKYIERCINSIKLKEDNGNVEVILIDDGSKDSSGAIADRYEQQYDCIRVIHKNNEGLSEARNDGIKNAKGEYVLFLDSDDYLIDNAIDTLLKRISQYTICDIIYFEVICKKHDGQIVVERKNSTRPNEIISGKDLLKNELRSGRFKAMAVLGLYKRNYLITNNLFFKRGILHEDEEWAPRVLYNADHVICLSDSIYGYEIRKDSITTNKDKTRNAKCIMDICKWLNIYFSTCEDNELIILENRYLAKLYMGAVSRGINSGNKRDILSNCNKEFVRNKGISIQDKIRTSIFRFSPLTYARIFSFLDN